MSVQSIFWIERECRDADNRTDWYRVEPETCYATHDLATLALLEYQKDELEAWNAEEDRKEQEWNHRAAEQNALVDAGLRTTRLPAYSCCAGPFKSEYIIEEGTLVS